MKIKAVGLFLTLIVLAFLVSLIFYRFATEYFMFLELILFVVCFFMLIVPIFKGKHWFENTGEKPMPDFAPNWLGYRCKHCGEISGLDLWQILQMPGDMAFCRSGKKMSLLEIIFFTCSIKCID